MRDLKRLLYPKSIAVVGGGAWCEAVISQAKKMQFKGHIYPVHPKAVEICGYPAFKSVSDLPMAPDACFVGVNRMITLDIVAELRRIKAGGAICFASGFAEAQNEDDQSGSLQQQLLETAGEMPILGPNCYGFINAMDCALLWPDQHGCTAVDRGVAILTQSSNIAINLSMQKRALPIAFMVTCGNMAQTSQAEIATALLDDPRITAIGLHIEGFGNLREWEEFAKLAHQKNIPIVALKVGKSVQAQNATISHTASMAGGDTGAQLLLDRLGIARVDTLPVLLETLKLLHVTGPLPSNKIASISCSGGEASLAADLALPHDLEFPALNARQAADLRDALGPKVALANPLDYHTYIWRDTEAMTKAWSALVDPALALTMTIVDYPRGDTCDAGDWICATNAAIETRTNTGGNIAVVATLPELLPEDVAQNLIAAGVVPIQGLEVALAAAKAAVQTGWQMPEPLCPPRPALTGAQLIDEYTSKAALKAYGAHVPNSIKAATLNEAVSKAKDLRFPVVVKALGLAHKTENNAVIVGLQSAEDILARCAGLPSGPVMIEEMVSGTVAELLIGVTKDNAHGFILTIAAGGILTEVMQDKASVLIPATPSDIMAALKTLRCYKLLAGYRGKPAADMDAIIKTIAAVQNYVIDHIDTIEEIEINPLICTPTDAVAVDALINKVP